MSPHEAAEWGSLLASVPEHQREALCAWVRSGDYVAEGTGDLPGIPDFEDRYCGECASFREYAEELADGTGLLSAVSDDVAWYFDWSMRTRDLAFDYTVGGAEHRQARACHGRGYEHAPGLMRPGARAVVEQAGGTLGEGTDLLGTEQLRKPPTIPPSSASISCPTPSRFSSVSFSPSHPHRTVRSLSSIWKVSPWSTS